MNNTVKFSDLGLSQEIIDSLTKKGFEYPTPIQAQAIPFLLQNEQDLIGKAQTGTGKTASFGIPIIEHLKAGVKSVQALILAPTRELAIQVAEELKSFAAGKAKVATIYGGQPIDRQISDLKKSINIVVGTPGRIIDHLDRGTLNISQISHLVLDEADEMLNMGFVEDIEKILKSAPQNRRTILFSATMPSHIENLAKKYMKNYQVISVISNQKSAKNIQQIYFEVDNSDKFEALTRIIDNSEDFYGMIFCKTKVDTDEIALQLSGRGFATEALHGNVSQSQREKILTKFRNRKINILVATDVAARGIDVENLSHVVNYSLPQDSESYVHRIGRTGRAGKSGIAISIITPSEFRKLQQVQRIINDKIEKGQIPDAENLIVNKQQKFIKSIIDSSNDNCSNNLLLAQAIYEQNQENIVEIIASLIKIASNDQFNPEKYRKINQGSGYRSSNKGTTRDGGDFRAEGNRRSGNSKYGASSGNSRNYNSNSGSGSYSGKVELFIAKGRNDNFNESALSDFVANQAGVSRSSINNIKIHDQFSFFSTNNDNANKIIDFFRSKSKVGKSLVTRAKRESR
jgi:ATP-dependent RNA helicase DeaD